MTNIAFIGLRLSGLAWPAGRLQGCQPGGFPAKNIPRTLALIALNTLIYIIQKPISKYYVES